MIDVAKKSFSCLCLCLVGTMLALSGCVTDSKMINTAPVTTLNDINIQDWNQIAEDMTSSLLSSPAWEAIASSHKTKKPVLKVSKIINKTSQNIDTDMLTQRIIAVLINSGKVTAISEDEAAKQASDLERFARDDQELKVSDLPSHTLSGKIIETKVTSGNVKQVTFTFQMSLNTVKSKSQVWTDVKDITKQEQHSRFGL